MAAYCEMVMRSSFHRSAKARMRMSLRQHEHVVSRQRLDEIANSNSDQETGERKNPLRLDWITPIECSELDVYIHYGYDFLSHVQSDNNGRLTLECRDCSAY
jgi:hypothetical protein